MAIRPAEHLLILPVPFFRVHDAHDGLLIETQARAGVERWCENFSSLIVAAPLIPPDVERRCTYRWTHIADLLDRVQCVELPWAFTPWAFAGHYRATSVMLRECVQKAGYLQFAVGAFFGDWAGVAAEIAHGLGRPYAVHVDRVEHRVIVLNDRLEPLHHRLRNRILAPLMKRWHERLMRRAAVTLCHGADCLEAYQHAAGNPQLVHNIHIEARQALDERRLAEKIAALPAAPKLRICYAGRIAADKAPLEWVQVIARLRDAGVPIVAEWLGDGPLGPAMESLVRALDLRDHLRLRGYVDDRSAVLEALRNAHIMLFTHITPESPRCLIEALQCGTPIVGYDSAYPRELIASHGGGRLTPLHDVTALASAILELNRDRRQLANLVAAARLDAARFDTHAVFAHRSNLIRQFLTPPRHAPAPRPPLPEPQSLQEISPDLQVTHDIHASK